MKPRCEVRCDEYDLRSVHFHRRQHSHFFLTLNNQLITKNISIYIRNIVRWCFVYKTMSIPNEENRLLLHFAPIFSLFSLLSLLKSHASVYLEEKTKWWQIVAAVHFSLAIRIKSNISAMRPNTILLNLQTVKLFISTTELVIFHSIVKAWFCENQQQFNA